MATLALAFSCLLLLSGFAPVSGARLRRRSIAAPGTTSGASFEVVETTSIEAKKTEDCICEKGQFWHWRIKQCIGQGAWGYECGFFPEEHHQYVCRDALKCQVLDQSSSETKVTYSHEGAVPANCQHCTAGDNCKAGDQRDCLEQSEVSGEACATVRVTLDQTVTAEATKEHTASATAQKTVSASVDASAEKKATATATETAVDSAKRTAKGEVDGIKATVTVNEKATATEEASVTVTKKATATASSEATHESSAQSTAKVSAKAAATKQGVAEEKRCVDVTAVKKQLGLEDVAKIGPVLASNIVEAGDKAAFDLAYEAAMKAAQANGASLAEGAAKALAAQKAAKDAEMAANAKASEDAAWKAEAGAKEKATIQAGDVAQTEADAKAAEAAANSASNIASSEAKDKAAQKAEDAAKAKADANVGKAAEAAAQTGADAVAEQAAATTSDQENLGTPTNPPEGKGTPPKMTKKDVAAEKP